MLPRLTVAPVAIATFESTTSHAEPSHSAKTARLGMARRRVEQSQSRSNMWWIATCACCGGGSVIKLLVIVAVAVGVCRAHLLQAPRLQTEFFPKVDAGQFICQCCGPKARVLKIPSR